MACITVTWNRTATTWSASQSPETAQQQHGVHHSHLKQHSNNMECITVTWNRTATTWSASQSPETEQQQHGVHHSHQSPETAQQQHGVHHSHLKQNSNNMECITVTWNRTATTKVSHVSLFFLPSPHLQHLNIISGKAVLDSSTKQSLISRRTKFVTNLEKGMTDSTDPVNQFKYSAVELKGPETFLLLQVFCISQRAETSFLLPVFCISKRAEMSFLLPVFCIGQRADTFFLLPVFCVGQRVERSFLLPVFPVNQRAETSFLLVLPIFVS